MKRVLYSADFREVGTLGFSLVKFAAGTHYPVTDETLRHVGRGIAREIDVEDEPEAPVVVPGGPNAETEAPTAEAETPASETAAPVGETAAPETATPASPADEAHAPRRGRKASK